jgi:hypothetical protein
MVWIWCRRSFVVSIIYTVGTYVDSLYREDLFQFLAKLIVARIETQILDSRAKGQRTLSLMYRMSRRLPHPYSKIFKIEEEADGSNES